LQPSENGFITGNTIPPKLTLPYKSKETQNTTSTLLHMSPTQEVVDFPIQKVPPPDLSVSLLETAPMFAVRPREIDPQRQSIFADALMEDMALRTTLVLPAMVLMQEQQRQTDQRQVVASTAGGAAIAGIGDITLAAMRYLTQIAMTHMLSQSVYGIFTTAYAIVTVLGMIAKVGLESTMLRFLSIYRTKDERGYIAGLVRFVLWTTLISGLLFAVLLFLSATALAHFLYHSDEYVLPFKESAVLIPLIALQSVLANGLLAWKAIKWKVYVDRLIHPVLTLISIGIFYLLGLRLEAAILAAVCGFVASVIVGQILLSKASQQVVRGVVPQFERTTWLRFALPMVLNAFVQNALSFSDVILLAVFTSSALVGIYAAADRLGFTITIPFAALSMVFSPLIAEYYTRGEHQQLANMFKIVTKWSFSLGFLVFLCLCIFHEAILSIFSRGYISGGNALIILSLGYLANTALGPANYLLLMAGRPRIFLTNMIVTLIINFILIFVLVPRFNIVGAALSSTCAEITLDLLGFIEVFCLMKIHPYRWDMFKPIVAGGTASGIALLLLQFIHLNDGLLPKLETLGLIILFILIYILTLALLRFSEEDMIVFNAILTKLGRKKLLRA
jgi:O-antigen/teichoic acid export membrane protein